MDRFSIILGKKVDQPNKPNVTTIKSKTLKEQIEQLLGCYIPSKNIHRVRMELKNFFAHIVVKYLEDKDTKEFPSNKILVDIQKQDEFVIIKPMNLYTLLLLHGILIPYEETLKGDSFLDEETGILYSYKEGFSEVIIPGEKKIDVIEPEIGKTV